ncbi:hypothetical protein Pen02_20520 [Plantactinospora endophytica]|uniref:DUF5753 domain-containing protein n=1 Tax=Plantactinospora endophytica TaxID=673535 RepID=A0ABQ4DXF3_9ACTN|nr:Scr1 family TA system antitoxin-like transcriptional regulator [Plantactinospora endophytica]GIG87116.1 hypothetical protein Pen02_20520 [Plantactinospora endophytica]
MLEPAFGVTVSAVLDESVLRRPVGGPALMRGQLKHLGELLRRPNVDVRVLPATVGLHPESKRYAEAYARLQHIALDPSGSAKLIATIAEEL